MKTTKNRVRLPETLRNRTEYKRKFSLWELYNAFVLVPGAVRKLIANKKKQLLADDFIERLQLSVSQVNACPACSYVHAQMALKQGLSNEEIFSFLSGDGSFVKPYEAKAIVFAQHFADSRGKPTKEAYQSIVQEYGAEKADIIFAAVHIMLVGNIYGIPYSSFRARMKGRPYKNSSVAYELGMQVAFFVCPPIAFIHAGFRHLLGNSAKRFSTETAI